MSTRPTLDVPSFEKLLAAAWILQCERDRILSGGDIPAVELERRIHCPDVESQTPSVNLFRETNPSAPVDLIASEVAEFFTPVTGTVLAEQPEPVEAPALMSSPSGSSMPDAVPTGHLRKAATQVQNCAVCVTRLVRAVSKPVQRRKKEGLTIRLRLVIPERTLRLVKASVAPISLLLIIAGFLLSLPFGQRPAQASPRTETQGREGGPRQSWDSSKINYAEPAKAERAEIGATSSVLSLEASHLRITDAATASVVNDLSPYEMQSLERQAEYGDQFAALALGMAYETGHHVHRSCTKAAEWIAFAATSGNAAAQYNLALRYLQGDGIPPDSQAGQKWLQIAANRGYPKATLAVEARSAFPAGAH